MLCEARTRVWHGFGLGTGKLGLDRRLITGLLQDSNRLDVDWIALLHWVLVGWLLAAGWLGDGSGKSKPKTRDALYDAISRLPASTSLPPLCSTLLCSSYDRSMIPPPFVPPTNPRLKPRRPLYGPSILPPSSIPPLRSQTPFTYPLFAFSPNIP